MSFRRRGDPENGAVAMPRSPEKTSVPDVIATARNAAPEGVARQAVDAAAIAYAVGKLGTDFEKHSKYVADAVRSATERIADFASGRDRKPRARPAARGISPELAQVYRMAAERMPEYDERIACKNLLLAAMRAAEEGGSEDPASAAQELARAVAAVQLYLTADTNAAVRGLR